MAEAKEPTHTAYALKRETRLRSRPIEIGHAQVGKSVDDPIHVYLDRVPVGGWSGHLFLAPVGIKPPELHMEPERPVDDN
jgi:hypothetical protein